MQVSENGNILSLKTADQEQTSVQTSTNGFSILELTNPHWEEEFLQLTARECAAGQDLKAVPLIQREDFKDMLIRTANELMSG